MSDTDALQISLFRSHIHSRRFDDGTLRILESVLASKDVKSSLEVRSSLREFMRFESLSVIHEISEKTVEQKLSVLEFFVLAFALAGDVEVEACLMLRGVFAVRVERLSVLVSESELSMVDLISLLMNIGILPNHSCLALRYEALVLRDLKSATYQWLQVSYREWLTFAEHSLDNGFYSIARKACENALLCLQMKDISEPKTDDFFENVQVIEKIKRLKDVAVASAASRSVQAQAAEYLKKKTIERSRRHASLHNETKCFASTLFRNGINKRNARKLHERQNLQQITNE